MSSDGNYEMAATRAPFAGSRETLALRAGFFKSHVAVCESIGTMGDMARSGGWTSRHASGPVGWEKIHTCWR